MKKCSKIKELFYNNKLVCKDQDIANTLNEHFSTIGSRMANNIKPSKSYKDFLNNSNIRNFYLYPTDKVETYKGIKNLKPRHSCWHDNISPKLVIKKNTPTSWTNNTYN